MSKKEILLICLLLCFICSLQVAVAVDVDANSTDNIKATHNLDVVKSTYVSENSRSSGDNQVLSEDESGTFTDLSNVITNGGNTIELNKNYTFNSDMDGSLTNGIVIGGTKTIDGKGTVVIDAKDLTRIFMIPDGSTVTLKGITFMDGHSNSAPSQNILGHGGSVMSSGVVHIENCKFIDSIAYEGNGGSVFINGAGSTITNSYFEGSNTIYNPDNSENHAIGGAVFIATNNIVISHSTFIDNIAGLNGGAIGTNDGTNGTTIMNCTFINNTAGYNGGAVNWISGAYECYIINSTFTNNFANRSGGAIYWNGSNGIVSNCSFTHNNASGNIVDTIQGILGGDGGAILWVGSNGIIKDNCIFIDNYAKCRGGAIYMHGSYTEDCTNITISHSKFNDNYAGMNGGAVDWNEGSHEGNIYYSTFTNNVAGSNGGAVFWSGYNGEIHYSNFTNNSAKGLLKDTHGNIGDGGAIIWSGMNGTVTNCRFIDNVANQRGGAVYLQNSTNGNYDDTTFSYGYFKNNTAGTNGGAIDWHEGAEDGEVHFSVFEQNTAKRSGGAIYWNGNIGEIKDSNFTNNKALGINNATDAFGNVTYGGDGGAVIWIGSEGTVTNCRFVDNVAAKRGGEEYLQDTPIGNCTHTSFINSYFKNNTAGTNGGAIDWYAGVHNGLVDNVTFSNNTAKRNGGAIFWHGDNGTVKNSNFINNRASDEAIEYDMSFNMATEVIVVKETSEIPLLADSIEKFFVLNQTSNGIGHFESYVVENNEGSYSLLKLDEIDVSRSESIISPVGWAINQLFGDDGGTILWSGDIGLVYKLYFHRIQFHSSWWRGYMTGSDYVTFD